MITPHNNNAPKIYYKHHKKPMEAKTKHGRKSKTMSVVTKHINKEWSVKDTNNK